MGLVSSSQSGTTSLFVKLYTRSTQSEFIPSEPQEPPLGIAKSISRSPSVLQSGAYSRPENIAVNTSVSTKLKERQAWYSHLKGKQSVSKKKAKKSALIVRSLILGPTATASPKITKDVARPQLTKIKSHLVEPKSAKRIIAELRTLPALGEEMTTTKSVGGSSLEHQEVSGKVAPIHAVCLEHTDAEEDRLHFSKLNGVVGTDIDLSLASFAEFGSASIDSLVGLMNDIHVIDLISSPDLGLGQPGNGSGVLAGAVPTPETVIKGVEQITPQLLALGFAVGKAILPDHQGVHPPTDRMSVLTYWWGFELLLPPPSLAYLSSVHSVSGAVMNFLTALSLVNNGVREILPLVRYISQFVDYEFNQIKGKDQGKGVVCAATWIMPAALVPRPWDFPDPPVPSINPPKGEDELSPPSSTGPTDPKPNPTPAPKPSPVNGMPFLTPVPVNSISDAVVATNGPTNNSIIPAL